MSRRLRGAFGRLDLEDDAWVGDYDDGFDEVDVGVEYYGSASENSAVDSVQHGTDSGSAAGTAADGSDGALPADCGDVCAICLGPIELEDLAIVKGCEHTYCVNCILRWALYKEAPWCPQCKAPFNYLYTHRTLDGTLSDCPVEDSVCLLKRAPWFVAHIKTLENGKAVSGAMAAADDGLPPEWADGFYDDAAYYEEDDDEQLEQFYFSRAAGRARIVLGNRRLGENGFQRAGRMYARPANNTPPAPAGKAKPKGTVGGNIGKAGSGSRGAASSGVGASSSGAGALQAPPVAAAAAACVDPSPKAGPSEDGCMPLGGNVSGQGRRAKRNARRAAADLQV